MYFKVFLKVNVQNGDIFGANRKNFKYFWECSISLILFWGKQEMLGPGLRMEKVRVSPL